MEMSTDFERLLFFEHARRTAETTYIKDPLDADNLTKWGGVLLELSQFQNGQEDSKKMIQDAIDKLEEALVVNSAKHDALWCLGNAYTSNAFLISDLKEAMVYFEKAADYYKQAFDLEPQNGLYKKSLDVSNKAPELHAELHKQYMAQEAIGTILPGPSSSSTSTKSSKKIKNSDLKYDIFGWIILALGIVTWVGFAKSNMPPPPPPR